MKYEGNKRQKWVWRNYLVLRICKLYWKEQVVSQKSILPRGARSDFQGKKNASRPDYKYYFQQRMGLYSAQEKPQAWHTDKARPSGSHPHVPMDRHDLPNLS